MKRIKFLLFLNGLFLLFTSSIVRAETPATDMFSDSDGAKTEESTTANAETNPSSENLSDSTVDEAGPNEADDPAAEKEKKKKKQRKKVKVKARIHTRWEMVHEPELTQDDEITNDFQIRRARFKLVWEPETWLMAVIQVGGFHRSDYSFRSLLRDAYLHFSPLQYLEVRAGVFKKPYSRLALRSSGKLRVMERGEGNDLILDKLEYGGRDLGVQFSGRLVKSLKLDYQLGFFNGTNMYDGTGRELGDEKDIVARMTIRPIKWFDLGANGSFKFFSAAENREDSAWSAGADAVIKVAGARLHLEGMLAENHLETSLMSEEGATAPLVMNALAVLSYRHNFNDSFTLAVEPVFMMELLDPDTDIKKDEILVYSPGFNSYFGKYVRLMIHGVFRRPFKHSREQYPRTDTLIVQLCFDI